MIHFSPRPSKTGPSRVRSILLASVAGAALIAAASSTGLTELAPWATAASAQTADSTATAPSAASQGPSFADLISKVEPAVVSVTVQLQPQTASLNGNGPNAGNGRNGPGAGNGRNAPPLGPNGGGQSGNPLDRFFGNQGQPQAPSNRQVTGEGAGFFVSSDGYIVTANHVVQGATSVKVTMADGTMYPAKVVGTDSATDVAVLKVDANKTFTYVQFADQMPRVGDWVVAIGNPYGLGETATAGIVSALARDLGDRTYDGYLQIDAPINEGNSGGPTFDVHGNVVGINDAIFTPSGGSVGIGFDVPADTAKAVTAAIEKSGHVTRAWLGVQVQDVTQDIADGLGLKDPSGALVSQPEANGPAIQAGINSGDVIVAVNGTPIKDGRGLAQSVAGLMPGTTVKLDVIRSGQSRSVNVTLGELPANPGG
jgi:serine protease Do